MPAGPPLVLARYAVLGRLASGGMGDVWLARARGPGGFDKLVVLKTIRPDGAGGDEAKQMFFREARLAGLLAHPNCVQVFELGEEDGTYFIVMEYIDGFPLSRIVKRGRPVPAPIVVRIAMDAAAGLDYAHNLRDSANQPLSLIHRDISPDNVLVTFAGVTKIVDFGIARVTAQGEERTQTGRVKGKYGYMAPEYLRGEAIDARADVFALGVTAFRALTGVNPFAAGTDAQVLVAVLENPAPSARSLRPDLPEALDAVLAKALEKSPARRYSSARELRAAFAAAMPDVADTDAVAAYLARLWPEDDEARVAVRTLAAKPPGAVLPLLRVPSMSHSTSPSRSSSRPSPQPSAESSSESSSGSSSGSSAASESAPPGSLTRRDAAEPAGAETKIEAPPTASGTGAGKVASAPRGRFRGVTWWAVGAVVIGAGAVTAIRGMRHRSSAVVAPASSMAASASASASTLASGGPAARGMVKVLVADFANQTGDPIFDGTLEPGFGVALEGASFINAYNRGAAHKLAAQLQPGVTALGPDVARLVATREGIAVVVTGVLSRVGSGYRLEVAALDGMTGTERFAGHVDAAQKDDLLLITATLAAKIRNALGDATPESVQTAEAETFTTSSLEAAHEYSLGQLAWTKAGDAAEAERRYLAAVALDPNMGRAYSGLAVLAHNAGRLQDSNRFFTLALSKIDRMSNRERLRTRGTYYLAIGDLDKAVDELWTLVAAYPFDSGGVGNLAATYTFRRDFPRALEMGRRSVENNPKSVQNACNYALSMLYTGRLDDARRAFEAVLADNARYELAHVGIAVVELLEAHVDAATARWKRLAALGEDGASRSAAGLADVALYEGRLADAADLLEAGVRTDLAAKNPDNAALKLATLGHVEQLRGRAPAARAALDQALAISRSAPVQFWVARVYVDLVDAKKAAHLADLLAAQLGTEARSNAEVVRAEIELARKNPRVALDHLRAAHGTLDTWIVHLDLVRAYVAVGAFAEAQSEAEACISRRGEGSSLELDENPTAHLLPPVAYWMGRALEGLHSPAAAESYAQFVAIKEHGQDPLLADARARLTATTSTATATPTGTAATTTK